jgi:hypothetical protein
MPDEIKVKHITVITRNPSGRGDLGACESSWYIIDEFHRLILTDAHGVPVHNPTTGNLMTHRMRPGDHEKDVAQRMTLELWRANRGDEKAEFNRPIRYSRMVY